MTFATDLLAQGQRIVQSGPSVGGFSGIAGGTGTAHSVTLPSPIHVGDLIIVAGCSVGQPGGPTVPGMTEIMGLRNGSDEEIRIGFFGEIAGGGEGGETRTITWANSSEGQLCAFVLRDVGSFHLATVGSGNTGSESGDLPEVNHQYDFTDTGSFNAGPRGMAVTISTDRPALTCAFVARDGTMAFDGFPAGFPVYQDSLVETERGLATAVGFARSDIATGSLGTFPSLGSFTWTGTEEWVTAALLLW